MADPESSSNKDSWENLKAWILQHEGGVVHPALQLCGSNENDRGVFATAPIPKGHVLLCLPAACALDGRLLPDVYGKVPEDKKEKQKGTKRKTASPWLRCLAAFYQSDPASAYRASLPETYETLWQWSDQEIAHYLAGTTCPGGGGWNADPVVVRERYQTQVRPYLEFLHVTLPKSEEAQYQEFERVCQTMSTRCFHLSTTKTLSSNAASSNATSSNATSDEPSTKNSFSRDNTNTNTKNDTNDTNDTNDDDDYSGPFFLPAVDLLNHSSSHTSICTTLQRTSTGFLLVADVDIQANQEILHSYGPTLSSSHFLHTFGFCPAANNNNNNNRSSSSTPAVLDPPTVLDACYRVMRSKYPHHLAQHMRDAAMEDEVWTMPSADEPRDVSFLPPVLMISPTEPLSNALVTCACIAFLPICAYREAARSYLDRTILDDYFLGKLVCTALLKALEEKWTTYTPIEFEGTIREDDAALLQELVDVEEEEEEEKSHTTHRRLMYGLRVRLGEKESLQATRREVLRILASLDDGAGADHVTGDDDVEEEDDGEEETTQEDAVEKAQDSSPDDANKRKRQS
jgi:hypothetical protein